MLLNFFRYFAGRETVERGFGHFRSAKISLAGKRDNRLVRALALLKITANGVEILDGAVDAARHNHSPCLAADLTQINDLFVEVVHHDFGLHLDGVTMTFDVMAKLLF